jgi:hypothetical protein
MKKKLLAGIVLVVLLGAGGVGGYFYYQHRWAQVHKSDFYGLTRWAKERTQYNQVAAGMTKDRVIALMGRPSRQYPVPSEHPPTVEEWSYEFPDGPGHITITFDGGGLVVEKQFGYD